MRFALIFKNAKPDPMEKGWEEQHTEESVVTEADALAYGRKAVDTFNANVKAGERSRVLVGAVIMFADFLPHEWEKQNVATKCEKSGVCYDDVRCRHCGATGRRYGAGNFPVSRDAKFSAKRYEKCTRKG